MFYGEFQVALQASRRLRLPSKYAKLFSESSRRSPIVGPVGILIPIDRSVSLFPFDFFQNQISSMWVRDVVWEANVEEIVSNNVLHPCDPLFQSDVVSEKIRGAVQVLREEGKLSGRLLRQLSGRDFEKLVAEVFGSLGATVQANIHVLGAEIDLLLVEVGQEGAIQFSVVECKHRVGSRRVVTLSEVMRLYGLGEALGKQDLSIKRKLIVTTTGFSPRAKQFARVYNMDLLNYEALTDWIRQNGISGQGKRCPVFRIVRVDGAGRLYLPGSLIRHLRVALPGGVAMVGIGDGVELWNPRLWDQVLQEGLTTFQETALELLREHRKI